MSDGGGTSPQPMWRRCETAWSAHLQTLGHLVVHLCDAQSNSMGTEAPMISIGGKRLRAPDLESKNGGVSQYWEIKYRARPAVDPLSGRREHRIDLAAFHDYCTLFRSSGQALWIMVYEKPDAATAGRWFRIHIEDAISNGRAGACPGNEGAEVESWLWPVEAMDAVSGPVVETEFRDPPLFSDDEPVPPASPQRLRPLERQLRRKRWKAQDASEIVGADVEPINARTASALEADNVASLEILRSILGIPSRPRYSVLLVGGKGLDLVDVFGVLDYGIRVFLVTETKPEQMSEDLKPFDESRLVEWSTASGVSDKCEWIVDGQFPEPRPAWLQAALENADDAGGFNLRQYEIVHAPPGSDVLVTAGAGTGKTETMSERLVFLLSTFDELRGDCSGEGTVRSFGLSLSEIGLVTFTREAASEIRQRIARTIVLRQRLSARCVHPIPAWLMQLGTAKISTIHLFAKGIILQFGTDIGIAPGFSVTQRTTQLRQLFTEELSPQLAPLYRNTATAKQTPAIHLWLRHLDTVWNVLENNGVPLLSFGDGVLNGDQVNWGRGAEEPERRAVEITRRTIEAAARRLTEEARRSQFLGTNQLVPAALASISKQGDYLGKRGGRLKFLFVDEFQDTDEMQMNLLLTIRQHLDARLFVVGDAKQGVYRFRGAAGDAFDAIKKANIDRGLPPFKQYYLTRNFRADGNLLNSLHPFFSAWGDHGELPYGSLDQLRPNVAVAAKGIPIEFRRLNNTNSYVDEAAQQVLQWRSEDQNATIAILCRRNSHAQLVQRRIRELGGSCRLLVGGSFFLSEAVRELRVLLEAVSSPNDNAALLELCETRWAGALTASGVPGYPGEQWSSKLPPSQNWGKRVSTLATSDSLDISDLASLRQRVWSLTDRLRQLPAIAFIVECLRSFKPEGCAREGADDENDRRQYALNLNHLTTLLDAQFAESPATLASLLQWLKIQIATNRSEDEPANAPEQAGTTTALTVHKAKGLEFDRVLIPNTWTSFEAPSFIPTQAMVLNDNSQKRLVWKWNVQAARYMNTSGQDQLWVQNDLETRKEETRLLYVAFTRAKHELLVFRPRHRTNNTWDELISIGDQSS